MRKFIYLFIFLSAFTLMACGLNDSAVDDDSDNYNPIIHTLEKIEGLDGSKTLVLNEVNSTFSSTLRFASNSLAERCEELGEINAGNYVKIPTEGNLTPCFKGVRKWKGNQIYGQYRPDTTADAVWFITDIEGNVHHFRREPLGGSQFKNRGRLREYKGKPAYLNEYRQLTTFDLSSDEEEVVVVSPMSRFVVIDKPTDGEHIVYVNLDDEGQRQRPDESIEGLSEINTYRFFYKNNSGDLGYINSMYFKNMLFDSSGDITDKVASSVPVAYQSWADEVVVGSVAPKGPLYIGAIGQCTFDDGLMLCGNKGFLVGDSSTDMREVAWCDFEHCSQLEAISCSNEDYIYYFSQSSGGINRKLTQITRNLSALFEHVLEDVDFIRPP